METTTATQHSEFFQMFGQQSGGRKAWADLQDSSDEEVESQPPKRPRWADLQDSSCEDRLDSQPPPAILNTDSYIETPEPSFDDINGSVLCSLRAATALNNDPMQTSQQGMPSWMQNSSAPGFIVNGAPAAMQVNLATALSNQTSTAADRMPHTARHRFRHKRRAPASGARPGNRRSHNEESSSTSTTAFSALFKSRPGADQANNSTIESTLTVSDEDWARRHEKRTNVVQSIKTTPEYETMADLRGQGLLSTAAPGTPNPHDRTISKRKWESLVMNWRTDLKQYTNTNTTQSELGA